METSISMADFYEKYQNENLELIDVREIHEFQACHLSRWSAFCLCLPISQLPRPHRY